MQGFRENLQRSACRRRSDDRGLQQSALHPVLTSLSDAIHAGERQLQPFLTVLFRQVSIALRAPMAIASFWQISAWI